MRTAPDCVRSVDVGRRTFETPLTAAARQATRRSPSVLGVAQRSLTLATDASGARPVPLRRAGARRRNTKVAAGQGTEQPPVVIVIAKPTLLRDQLDHATGETTMFAWSNRNTVGERPIPCRDALHLGREQLLRPHSHPNSRTFVAKQGTKVRSSLS